MVNQSGVQAKKSLKEIVKDYYHKNALAEAIRYVRDQNPIHLSDIPGDKVIIVATRGPEPGKPLSGGMAPAVIEACKSFQHIYWYSYGEHPEKSRFNRVFNAGFQAFHNKSIEILPFKVFGINVRMVKATKDAWDGQYNEFCNRWVWPMCHNLFGFVKRVSRDDFAHNWTANDHSAMRIKSDLNGDKKTPIWIHDYHHMSLASALRRHGCTNPIVYFHHIPLPTIETLQKDQREMMHFMEMVEQLKACDAVVFQTEETTKRFYALIEATAPANIAAYTGNFIDSDMNGSAAGKVFIGHAPISINTQAVKEFAKDPNLQSDEAKELDPKLIAENIFINFERCDYSKGILERVVAFKKLMEDRPDLRGKTQLVLGAEPTRGDVPEYKIYREAVNEIVAGLNENYKVNGKDAVIFNNERIVNSDVIRLMGNRHEGQRRMGLVTPHEDGMNLTAKEFAAANGESPLILSSGAGTAAELGLNGKGAVIFDKVQLNEEIMREIKFEEIDFKNPESVRHNRDLLIKAAETANIGSLVAAMKQGIDMPKEEARTRGKNMQDHLDKFDIQTWGKFFKNMFDNLKAGTFYPASKNDPKAGPQVQAAPGPAPIPAF